MEKENKKSKKKILLTYLILAACLLVIAAITVTVVLTVNRNPDLSIDNPNQNQTPDDDKNNDNDNQGGAGDDKPGDDTPTTTPETGYKIPVDSAVVTTRYEFALNETIEQYRVHQGIDFEGSVGDSVFAVLDGTVTQVVTDSKIGENYVTISHADGVTSTYKYIEAKEGLKAGDSVKRGDVIGTIATASGYEMKQKDHLHFEMSVNGKSADPETYLDLVEK